MFPHHGLCDKLILGGKNCTLLIHNKSSLAWNDLMIHLKLGTSKS